MADHKRIDEVTGTHTSGHEWDGIEELDTPMPRWWLWTLYATIVWAIGYAILYPAWPMVERSTAGVLGWSSRGQLDRENDVDVEGPQPPARHRSVEFLDAVPLVADKLGAGRLVDALGVRALIRHRCRP